MRLFFNILLILLAVSTLSICLVKPDMHKRILVYDSGYTLVPETSVEIETAEIPIMEQPVKPKTETIKSETVSIPKTTESKKQIVVKTIPKTEVKKQTNQTKSITNSSVKKVQTEKPITVNKQEIVKQQEETPIAVKPKSVETAQKKIEQPVIVKEVPKPQPKVLSQQEETIAWNVWRSNLQNKIMQDTKLPYIPNGIEFRFTFNVDKYGKISNLQTWSNTQGYTPYAIQFIAPVIRSYQGRSILNFPEGTARTSTQVTGGWRISQNEKYSTPNDYNDVEKINR